MMRAALRHRENHTSQQGRFRAGLPNVVSLFVMFCVVLFFAQSVFAQVTIFAPRDNTRVDFERLGLRVDTYTAEQLENMTKSTAISVGQSIDASILVLTGAHMPIEAFAGAFETDEIRVAFDDLFRRGGMLFIGQHSGGAYNRLPTAMRDYFEDQDVFLPTAGNRPTTTDTIGTFTAYGNPALMELPILSKPHSLAQGDWAGVQSNLFYFRDFPDTVLPILVGTDDEYPVMILQEGIFGNGKLIISQARDLTRLARSEFWENLIVYLGGNISTGSSAAAGASAGPQGLTLGGAGRPLMFVETFKDVVFKDIAEADMFDDPRIWEAFDEVELSIYDTGEAPGKATRARLGIIGDYLVAAFHADEPNPSDIRAEMTVRDDQAWTDDCVELVVVPHEGGSLFHIILTAGGAIYDARDRNRLWGSEGLIYDVRIDDDAWRAVIAVPLEEIFEDGKVPDVFFANLAREEQTLDEITSWVAPIHGIPSDQSVGHVSTLSPRELASRLIDRPVASAHAATGEGFDIWQVSPWQDGVGLNTRPMDDAGPGTVELNLPQRGTDAAVILVRNNEPETLTFKVDPSRELKAAGGQSVPFYDVATLYRGIARLSSYETLGFDPLEDIGNGSLLSVGPGETAMLWIDAVGDGAAGQYRGELSLTPITIKDQTPINVPIHLHIYDVEIPDPLPLQVYTWGPYMAWIREKSDPMDYVDLALDSHINTFNVAYPVSDAIKPGPEISKNPDDYMSNVADFLEHGRDVRFVYSYHLFDRFDSALKSAGFTGETMDDQWQALFVEWVGQWMNALESAGVGYDDFWIQIEDEPRTHALPELIAKTALLKKHFPEVQTWVSIAPWSIEQNLHDLQPYIDLWVPERRRITMRETAPEELAFYHEQGDFWPYLCSRQMDMQSLMSYYRYRGIQDYLLGGDGMVLWAFNAWRGNPWAQWDSTRSDGSHSFDEGLVYRGEFGPIPSTRLFAFRTGIEDYVLLYLLSEVEEQASDTDRQKIEQFKAAAEAALGTNNPQVVEEWRLNVLTFLESHQ